MIWAVESTELLEDAVEFVESTEVAENVTVVTESVDITPLLDKLDTVCEKLDSIIEQFDLFMGKFDDITSIFSFSLDNLALLNQHWDLFLAIFCCIIFSAVCYKILHEFSRF